jgi:predicted double-glycine peptidase
VEPGVIVKLSQLWSPAWKIAETDADISAGKLSRTRAPLRVSRMGRGRYFVMDGNHRAMEAIMAGAREYPAVLDQHIPDLLRTGGAYNSIVDSAVNVARAIYKRANPVVAVDFKLAAAMRDLRQAIASESRHDPSPDQVEAMVDTAFDYAKTNWQKSGGRILPVSEYPKLRLLAVQRLLELVRGGALRQNPKTIPALPLAAARGMKVLKGFRPCKQTTAYTCGPACARAVLIYRGFAGVTEHQLAREAGTTRAHGTTPTQLCDLLHRNGARIVPTKRACLAWCLRQLRQSRPVVLLWNDWAGHWVVLIGYDAKRQLLLLADPAATKGVAVHSYATFKANWRTSVDGQVYRRLAVAIA